MLTRPRWLALAAGIALVAALATASVAHQGTASRAAAAQRLAQQQRAARRFRADGVRLEACGKRDYRCLQQAFGNIAYRADSTTALEALRSRLRADPPLAVGCHAIAHTIAAATIARDPSSLARELQRAQGDAQLCGAGFEHGLLTATFIGLTAPQAQAQARHVCDVLATGLARNDCAHGVGHGMNVLYGGMGDALRACEQMPGEQRSPCAGGVFMQDVADFHQAHPTGMVVQASDVRAALTQCAGVVAMFQRECYERIPQRLAVEGATAAQLAAACDASPADARAGCFNRFGAMEMPLAMRRFDTARAARICTPAGHFASDCVAGLHDHVRFATQQQPGRTA